VSSFIRGTIQVLKGTIAAQAIGVLALLVLSRLFEPSAFGHFQLFTACLTLALVAANLRYEIAILQVADDDERDHVLRLSFLINVAVVFTAALICGSLLAGLAPNLVSADARPVLWLLPVGLLVGGAIQLLGYLPLRLQDYATGASAKIAQAGGFALSGVALGLSGALPSEGLIVADVIGRSMAALLLIVWATRQGIRLWRPLKSARLLESAVRHREFALVAVPGGLINSAGGLLTSMLMYAVFNPATSGQYALMERSCIAPMGLVAVAVAQVFTGELARKLREGTTGVLHDYRRLVRVMFFIGIGPALVLGLLGPQLFDFVFGAQWRLAGEFAQLSAPLVLASFVAAPVNMTIMIAGRQRLQLAWEVARLLAMGTAWFAIANSGASPKMAVVASVTIAVTLSAAFLWLADWVIRQLPAHASPAA
jgi:O-antigen/teichoic acid export membrane protein